MILLEVSVVLLCLPVTFEQAGSVNVKFGESDNGIDEIILNEQSMISIIPVSGLFEFHPYAHYSGNTLHHLKSNCIYFTSISLDTIFYWPYF